MTQAGRARSTSVPKEWQEYYRTLTGLTDDFCRQHLNDEYAELARQALAALCRKRPSPLASGRPQSWGCAVLYALGQVNFLSDPSSTPFMTLQDLCARFGVSASTAGNKAREVREALRMRPFDHRWMLPSRIEQSGLAWMVEWNGLMVDARDLPLDLQEDAARRGLIPYVPAYRAPPEAGQPTREELIEHYQSLRRLARQHQITLADRLLKGPVAEIALRLGLIQSPEQLDAINLGALAPALDLALYGDTEDGIPRAGAYARELRAQAEGDEKALLAAMGRPRFSVFEVVGRHDQAGLMLRDLVRGDHLWLMDLGLERSAPMHIRLALRAIQPQDFWLSTGATVQLNEPIWRELERGHGIRRVGGGLPVPATVRLDERILGLATPPC